MKATIQLESDEDVEDALEYDFVVPHDLSRNMVHVNGVRGVNMTNDDRVVAQNDGTRVYFGSEGTDTAGAVIVDAFE